jgi:NADPH-dependent curcumin reductase CurA
LKSTEIIMKRHPQGWVVPEDFDIVERDLPARKSGELLVRNIYLSLDPYMRSAMDPVRSYIPHMNPGDTMIGGTVGQVLESDDPAIPAGAYVTGRLGWRSHSIAATQGVRVIDPRLAPLSTALGVLGMPGVTAHYGLLSIGRPKPGETVVVSAATGAVGSVVGQIAKQKGCRVVGIAGGQAKCDYAKQVLKFDECVDYRAPDLAGRLEKATPDFVDVSFENVGGEIMDLVMGRMNGHGRIAMCGIISQYNAREQYGIRHIREIIVQRLSIQGFIISEHLDYWPGALAELAGWVRTEKIAYREDITDGLQHAPAAFIRMLSGDHFGKQIVRVAPEVH